jgi:hypothetical protein
MEHGEEGEEGGVINQESFQGFYDNADLELATSKASINVGWIQAVDENFRIRFLIQETGGNPEDDIELQLQYELNATGGFVNVNATSSVVRSSASPEFVDEDDTAQLIGSGTFVVGNADEVDGLTGTDLNIDFGGSDETEVVFCVQIRAVDVVDNDTIQLRVVDGGGGELDTYTNTPTITVYEVAPLSIGEMMAAISSDKPLPVQISPPIPVPY